MRTTRMIGAGVLALLLGLTGCGGTDSKPADKAGGPPDPMPMPPADPYQLDPAKQAIPDSPVAGLVAKEFFKPEAVLTGDTLSLRLPKEGTAVREVSFKFAPKQAAALRGGLDVVVKPDQVAGEDVPVISVTLPGKDGNPGYFEYPYLYGLTLHLDKPVKRRMTGKVYLALPDEDKSYLTGRFEADCKRSPDELPGPDDAPFVQGKVVVTGGPTEPTVKVGYVGLKADGIMAEEGIESTLDGSNIRVSSVDNKPRESALYVPLGTKAVGRYEHINLEPGRYLVYVALAGGPVNWKWLTVEPGTQQTLDFTLDAGQTGAAETTLPADAKEKVYLTPADGPEKTDPPVAAAARFSLGIAAEPRGGKAAFDKLAPGKYELWGAAKLGALEVKRGETAKLDAAAKK